MIGAGNNKQVWMSPIFQPLVVELILTKFAILAEKVLEKPALVADPKFATNNARVVNRTELIRIITDVLMQHDRDHWLERFTGLGYLIREYYEESSF
jgi:crotonobetainyl-CoA:carnitine CoA-transferase CaiB-like acyl-CoA transferase